MYCYNCLNKIPDNSRKCPYCGQLLMPGIPDERPDGSKPSGGISHPLDEEIPLESQEISQEAEKSVPPPKEPFQETDKVETGKTAPSDTPEPSEPVEEYRMGDVIAQQYEVWEVIGTGGIGLVYKVRDRESGRIFALKRIRLELVTPTVKEKVEKEGSTWIQLRHPNLVETYEIGSDQDSVFVIMEYLEGLSLARLLEVRNSSKAPFGIEEVEPIFCQICQGLTYLHRVRVHGNLKPRNIIILPEYLKITDFGIADILDNPDFVSIQLEQGSAYYYLSPEKITDPERISQHSDVYSLGAILYEMLTNTTPMGEIVNPSQLNPNVDSEFDPVILKALKEKPSDRYQNIAEFFNAFYQALGKGPPPVDLTPEPEEEPLPEPAPPEEPEPEIPSPEPLVETSPPPPEPGEPEIPIETPTDFVTQLAEPPAPAEPTPSEPTPPEPTLPEPPPQISVPESQTPEPPPETPDDFQKPSRDVFLEDILTPDAEPAPPARERGTEEPPPSEPEYIPSRPPARSKLPLIFAVLGVLIFVLVGAVFFLQRQEGSKLAGEVTGKFNLVLDEYRALEKNAATQKNIPFRRAASEIEKIRELIEEEEYQQAQPLIQAVVTLLRVTREDLVQQEREEEEQRKKLEREVVAREAIQSAEKSQQEARKGNAHREASSIYKSGVDKLASARGALDDGQAEKAVSLAQESQAAFILALAKASESGPKKETKSSSPPQKSEKTVVATASKKCPDGMVFIAAGNFRMGSPANDPDRDYSEHQNKPVFVRDYCIDAYEYPNDSGKVPRANVSWFEAKKLCQSEGKRLCTEAEWEKACKGPKESKFPYGNTWDAGACNTQDTDGEERPVVASGSWSRCKSGYGVYDLSGNVKEWTVDSFSQVLADRTVKGGSATRPDWATRCAHRENFIGTIRNTDLGFRCCRDAQ